jgi:drug/metabolite transporter (DMT)-like permease
MFASLLTTLLFAMSAVYGQRTAVHFGSIRGNFFRLCLAALFLGGLTALFYRSSLANLTFAWLFFSGVIGFGLGDIGLFLAYPRLGSRLTILINLCLAPVWGAAVEFLWLGTVITGREALASIVILVGVSLALLPVRHHPQEGRRFRAGVLFAVIAGCGQGVGAVISRHSELLADGSAIEISGISAAFQRVLGGLVIAAFSFLIAFVLTRRQQGSPASPLPPATKLQKGHWLLGATLMGPVIGVSCFQWALKDTPSALVLAIVATAPILVMPMAWFVEGDRPSGISVLGAVIAVSGVVGICLIRA